MRKIIAFLVFAIMMTCVLTTATFAEAETIETVAEESSTTEPMTEPVAEPTTEPTTDPTTEPTTEPTSDPTIVPSLESIEETIKQAIKDSIKEPVIEPVAEEEPVLTTAEQIIAYGKENLEEISVVVTMLLTVFYQVRKHKVLNKSIGTLNNNAVKVAENSNDTIQKALEEMGGYSNMVTDYNEKIDNLLEEYRATAEDKQKLERTLAEVHSHLKTAKLANVELANEVAELLVLANIPNAKKDELYSRHLAAVGAIADADKTEVIPDVDGQEQK